MPYRDASEPRGYDGAIAFGVTLSAYETLLGAAAEKHLDFSVEIDPGISSVHRSLALCMSLEPQSLALDAQKHGTISARAVYGLVSGSQSSFHYCDLPEIRAPGRINVYWERTDDENLLCVLPRCACRGLAALGTQVRSLSNDINEQV